ncbi:ABC transporter permease [Ignisphaera sp. 4213-co]|uniref:ABC transporter permease n=1 Tax=Ignisphaera cupida TaxID=3050454 RepID=A0ABD4Z6U4_9CREN|nr:ABC transporter permease [Ignisphaera sp. 4213-co]MDK6029056.1 ABC transporter permease [Ignisphaera sp. 4213-co]
MGLSIRSKREIKINMSLVKRLGIEGTALYQFLSRIMLSEAFRPLAVVIMLYFAGSILAPHYFLSASNQKLILQFVAPLGLIATGEMIVILMGSIDLSAGSATAASAVLSALTYLTYGNFPLAILVGILIGLLIGMINGFMVAKLKILSFVGTLASMIIWRAVVVWLIAGKLLYGLIPYATLAMPIGVVPIGTIIVVLIVVSIFLLLKFTTFGRYLYAIGGNEEAVRIAGVNADIVKFIGFAIAGLLYGIGGIIHIGHGALAIDPWTAYGYELNAIASCVLGGIALSGGIGNPFGAFLGALTLTLLIDILLLIGFTQYSIQQIITGIILIAAASTLTRGARFAK